MNLQKSEKQLLGYEIFGNGAEKVIVLHDWLGDSSNWNDVRNYLDTESFTFIFADVRGYGKSKDLSGEYSTSEIAGDILDLADFLNFEKFHLIGHSMTGMAIQKLAIIDAQSGRNRLKSLIAVTPVVAGGLQIDEQTTAFFRQVIHNQEVTGQALAGLTGNRLSATWTKAFAAKNLATSRAEAMNGYLQMILGENFTELGKSVQPRISTLVVGGVYDLPIMQKDVFEENFPPIFANHEITCIEGAGHYPMVETPIFLATLIHNHLQKNI